jgi:hypothetical protein
MNPQISDGIVHLHWQQPQTFARHTVTGRQTNRCLVAIMEKSRPKARGQAEFAPVIFVSFTNSSGICGGGLVRKAFISFLSLTKQVLGDIVARREGETS